MPGAVNEHHPSEIPDDELGPDSCLFGIERHEAHLKRPNSPEPVQICSMTHPPTAEEAAPLPSSRHACGSHGKRAKIDPARATKNTEMGLDHEQLVAAAGKEVPKKGDLDGKVASKCTNTPVEKNADAASDEKGKKSENDTETSTISQDGDSWYKKSVDRETLLDRPPRRC